MPQAPACGGQRPSKLLPHSSGLLLLTAERLYSERGIDGPSLREIAWEAEQKKSSALHYHFGSKEALIEAILSVSHATGRRTAEQFLDEGEAHRRADVHTAVEALVRPFRTA